MKTVFHRAALLVLVAFASRAEIIDRIAVTAGKAVITESDVTRDLRVSAFLDQKPADLSPEQKRIAADRLVDQTLMLQEAAFSHVPLPTAEDAARMLEPVKAEYPSESRYRAALERYGITEGDLVNHLLDGLRAMRFSDLRFRPEVQISDQDVRELYDRMAAANPGQLPSFEASRAQLENLLTDQRISQALDRWLGEQRAETQIVYREAAFK